jgi:hypothetical protein
MPAPPAWSPPTTRPPPMTHWLRAMAPWKLGDRDEALEEMTDLAARHPDDPHVARTLRSMRAQPAPRLDY